MTKYRVGKVFKDSKELKDLRVFRVFRVFRDLRDLRSNKNKGTDPESSLCVNQQLYDLLNNYGLSIILYSFLYRFRITSAKLVYLIFARNP